MRRARNLRLVRFLRQSVVVIAPARVRSFFSKAFESVDGLDGICAEPRRGFAGITFEKNWIIRFFEAESHRAGDFLLAAIAADVVLFAEEVQIETEKANGILN